MLKQKEYNIADTNLALFGTDIEKKVKQAAAKTEKQWNNAGKKVGIQIWRIEKFQVVPWKESDYGKFYSGDSYILLRTYKKTPESEALSWDIHFWLGAETTQDEAGTAAYKTVELDDVLNGAAVQHREVQGEESSQFLGYFDKTGGVKVFQGGVESGFKHVAPTEYKHKLLWIKGKQRIRVLQVEKSAKSLNSGDCFILDCGLKIFQWNGSKSGPKEKQKAAQLARAMCDERGGKPELTVYEETDKTAKPFWDALGGEGAVAAPESVTSDEEFENQAKPKLHKLSDASGKIEFTKVAEGNLSRDLLDTNDAYILDVGYEVFVWIGKKSSNTERRQGLQYAQYYLSSNKLPITTPISRILEGGENEIFESYFDPSTQPPAPATNGNVQTGKPVAPSTTPAPTTAPAPAPVPANHTDQDFAAAKTAAEALFKAMKGLGTNDAVLLEIVSRTPNDRLQLVRREFAQLYGKELIAEVRAETSGNYRDLLVALLQTPVEYKTGEIRRAIKGLGTDETALIDILTQSTNNEIKEITQLYAKLYGKNQANALELDIIGDTSFNFKKALLACLKTTRDESGTINQAQVTQDATDLHAKGEGKIGTNDDFYIQVLSSRSAAHLQAVSKVYLQKHGKSLEKAIEIETSGYYKDTLLGLVRTQEIHFAHSIHEAIQGLGTANRRLIRAVVCLDRSKVKLMKETFRGTFKVPIEKEISDDTSFNFKHTLLTVLA